MEYVTAYITAGDKEEARKIGKELVRMKLIACANIISDVDSFFWWEGKIDNSKETIIICKTRKELCDKVIEKVKEMHSYDNPCITFSPINGSRDYLDWVSKSTDT